MPLLLRDPFQEFKGRFKTGVNPYYSQLLNEGAMLPLSYGADLKNKRGNYRAFFQRQGCPAEKIVVEIGSHYGKTLMAMAADHPHIGFVGLDITFKRVVTVARKALELKRLNTLTTLVDARFIEELYEPGEVDGIVAFFPDPWSKKKSQLNRRLFNTDFCGKMARVLKPGGFFWLKTDSEDYFHQASAALLANGFVPSAERSGLLARHYASTFEERFSEKKIPFFEGLFMLDSLDDFVLSTRKASFEDAK